MSHAARRAVRRSLATIAVSALALTGFAACGDEEPEKADDVVALSGLEKGDTVEPAEFVQTIQDGVEASSTAEITMEMDLGAAAKASGEGVVDYTSETPELLMDMSIDADAQSVDYEMRMVDGVLYLNMGELTDDKFWKVDPSDPDGPLAGMGLDKMLEQSDPIGSVARMEPAIKTVTYVGEEDVDGRELDHYELTIDLSKAVDLMGADLPQQVQGQMPEAISYDAWLDDENRFAQLEMEYEVMGQPLAMTMTADDWGTEADIEAPPADEVADMPSLGDTTAG
jgi:hypothetical protein